MELDRSRHQVGVNNGDNIRGQIISGVQWLTITQGVQECGGPEDLHHQITKGLCTLIHTKTIGGKCEAVENTTLPKGSRSITQNNSDVKSTITRYNNDDNNNNNNNNKQKKARSFSDKNCVDTMISAYVTHSILRFGFLPVIGSRLSGLTCTNYDNTCQ